MEQFNYSCPGDGHRDAVDTALHIHPRHSSYHNMYVFVPLQCDSPLVDDVRQLDGDNFLACVGLRAGCAVAHQMRCVVLSMLGLPARLQSVNGADGGKPHSQRIVATRYGNGHNPLEKPADWIVGHQSCAVAEMTHRQLGVGDRRVRRRHRRGVD